MKQMEKAQKVISAPVVEIPPGGREPIGNLAPRDAGKLAEELVAYHSQYADLYQRREQRQRCGVPVGLKFQTEPKLALEMVTGVTRRGPLPFQWVAADEHYGMNPGFLDGLDQLGKWYFVEVPQNTMVWPEQIEIIQPGQGARGAPGDEQARTPSWSSGLGCLPSWSRGLRSSIT